MGILETESVQLVESGVELFQLKPGDRLGVRLSGDVDDDAAEGLGKFLNERWPEFSPVVFVGDIELTVIRKERKKTYGGVGRRED